MGTKFYGLEIDRTVQTVNDHAATGIRLDRNKYNATEFMVLDYLSKTGVLLPKKGEVWENIALTERPFGAIQPAIDTQAEAIQPQGTNAFQIVGFQLERDENKGTITIFVSYIEIGGAVEPSAMEIGQFAHEFRQRGPVSAPQSTFPQKQ